MNNNACFLHHLIMQVFWYTINYLDICSNRWAVEQCLSHSAIESKVLLSAKQRYLPSAVLLGPKFALLVRLKVFDKDSPPILFQQECSDGKTFVVPEGNINQKISVRRRYSPSCLAHEIKWANYAFLVADTFVLATELAVSLRSCWVMFSRLISFHSAFFGCQNNQPLC